MTAVIRHIIIFWFGIATLLSGYSQDLVALNDSAWAYHETDFEYADSLANLALALALAQKNWDEEAQAYQTKGLIAYYQNDVALGQELQEKALGIYRSHQDTLGIAMVLNNIGPLYSAQGSCSKAARGYLEGMMMSRDLKNERWEMIFTINYFNSQTQCEQYADVANKSDSIISRLEQFGDSMLYLIGHLRCTQGFANYMLKEDSLAEFQLREAMRISRELDDEHIYAIAINNLGALYIDLKRFEEAEVLLRESILLDSDDPARTSSMSSYVNLGQVLTGLKRFEEADHLFDSALVYYHETGKKANLPNTYLAQGRNYFDWGKYELGVEAFERSIDMRDTVHSLEMKEKIAELQTSYQTKRLAQELEMTRLEADQRENRLVILMGAIIAGFVVVLGVYLVVFALMRRRQTEAEKRQIELEYTALRAQMNPHFIFNALNSIQGYFAEQDFARGNEYLGTFGQLMRSVLDQSSQASITLQQELETLELYLQLEQVRLKTKLVYRIQIEPDLDTSMVDLPPLVLQPFVENAIWHGIVPKEGPGLLDIDIWMEEEVLICTITDDGIGLDAAQKQASTKRHVSKGIHITRERLLPLGRIFMRELVDADGQSQGTRVTLNIPQTDD